MSRGQLQLRACHRAATPAPSDVKGGEVMSLIDTIKYIGYMLQCPEIKPGRSLLRVPRWSHATIQPPSYCVHTTSQASSRSRARPCCIDTKI